MDSSWFDDLTKALATSTSRRQALKAIAATSMGGMLSFLGIENTLANTCSGPGPGQPCASSKPHCCNGAVCSSGTCVCPSGLTNCNGTCVNLLTNEHNCGACGQACQPGQTCAGGTCSGCPSGLTNCNGTCVNLHSDPNHCGSCSTVCPSGSSCSQGVCKCANGYSLCNGTCVNLHNDPNNCGSCGHVCGTGNDCKMGICCSIGQVNCGGSCVNSKTDPNNCGACGHVCASGETCVKGACTCGSHSDCPSGQSCCSGTCVDEQNDTQNCGACGHTCPSGQTCQSGVCGCPSGTTNCSGTCVDTQTDPSNCGGCGVVCSGSQTCQGGQCICVSPPPPPTGPDALQCHCNDGTQINLCVTVNCLSGPAQDVFCGPACQCHGGEQGTGCSSGGCGCFTGHTLIAMADGTSRPIEHVQIGNVVLGHEGRINRVVDIKQPLLGKRPLYALNEGSFFVTAGHPFLTKTGWKSIDPAATAVENPAMVVERLAVGDHLLTLVGAAVPVGAARAGSAEAVDVHVEPVVLQSITSQPAGAATQLYNLQLDGNHTYFANGLLVHNK